jgi:hypothetical protein
MAKLTSDKARAIVARRVIHTRECVQCGERIAGIATRRYCSALCRKRAQLERDQTEDGLLRLAVRRDPTIRAAVTLWRMAGEPPISGAG